MTVEAGCVLQTLQEAARQRRLPVPAEPGGRRQLHHRRQPRDQRRRHAGRALRQHARPVPGAGSRHGAGRDLEGLTRPAQGQHRLRPARPVHRQRRHAGRHHRRDHEALSRCPPPPSPPGPPCPRWTTRCSCWAWRTSTWAPGLTGFEVMGQFALSLVAKHFPQMRVPLRRRRGRALLRAAGELGQRIRRRMRARSSKRCWKPPWKHGCVTDAVVAENLTQAHQLWHIRESIPLAQAEEGLNIKHDISIAVSRIPEFCRETDALLAREIPGVRLVNFGHLGDGNLHYNVQAPAGRRHGGLPARSGRADQHAGVRLGRAFRRLHSRPSTASARSRWTSWRSTSRRWRLG